MRRASYVAPLLLIAVGVLFLARNLYPDLPLLDYTAKYWPVVLIAWGALRVLEILVWAATSKPLPRSGVSGGEWVLIVFLCLIGMSLHTMRGVTNWWSEVFPFGGIEMLGERYDYPLGGERAASAAPHVVIEEFRGDAHISGGDGSAVKVTGHKTVRSLDQAQADRVSEETPLEIAGDANNVTVNLHQEKARGPQRISATLEISVPRGATVEVHGRNGDLAVNDITGSVYITSGNAGVQLKNIGGEAHLDLRRSDLIHLEAVRGAVDIKGRGSDIELDEMGGAVTVNGAYRGMIQLHHLAKPLRFTGLQTELNLEGVPGDIRMTLGDFTATGVAGPTRLSGRSRDVQIADFTGPLDVTVERGDLTLATGKLPLSRIQAHSRSGDIRLSLPETAQFTLNASTHNGDVANDFGAPLRTEKDGRRGSLRGSVGSGPAIDIETDRGQIALLKNGPGKNEPPKAEPQKSGAQRIELPKTGATPPLQKLEQ
jgi:DUF4097 and DUF4098 domain-containing protein YvlB